MKTYSIDLRPESDFATDLSGDCLFGQLCWQFAQDESLAGKISDLLEDYDTKPFLVVSDPVLSFEHKGIREFLLKRPFNPPVEKPFASLPFAEQKKLFTERKRRKGCKWVIVSEQQKLDPIDANAPVNVEDIVKRYGLNDDWTPEITYFQHHNSIDRISGTTGTDAAFAPYSQQLTAWPSSNQLTIFFALSDENAIKGLKTALERIGLSGYGADASTGKGRFSVGEIGEINLASLGHKSPDSIYTLGSSLPAPQIYRQICFETMVRFGKHGNHLANSEYPFKQPVLKAAAGAIFKPLEGYWPEKPFVGTSIRELSKFAETVEQGYSLYIPVKSEA